MISISYRAAQTGGGAYTPLDASGLNPLYTGFKPPMQGGVQKKNRYLSESPYVRATGNRSYTLTFTSTTTHASLDASLLYLLSQPAAIPDAVDLKIVQGGATFYFPACVFSGFDPDEPNGVTNNIKYTFIAPLLTLTAP